MIGRFRAVAVLMAIGAAVAGLAGWSMASQERTDRRAVAERIAAVVREEAEVDVDAMVSSLPEPAEIAERRAAIAEEMMEFSLLKFLGPPTPTAERGTFHAAIVDYLEWSSRRLDARLELTDGIDARRDALAVEVSRVRKIEEIYGQLARQQAVGVTRINLKELEFHRLGLEGRLALESGVAGE